MAENTAKIEGVKADSVLNKAFSGDFDSTLLLTQSNRPPMEEENSLLQLHLEEDMQELDTLNARIDAKGTDITEKTDLLVSLKAQLEAMKRKHATTVDNLRIVLGTQKSLEQLSQGYRKRIESVEFARELLDIHTEFADKSHSIISKSTQVLQHRQEQELGTISRLETSLKIAYGFLGVLSERKIWLEAHRQVIVGSIAKTRALMGWTRRLPAEILAQIFVTRLNDFIEGRIKNPESGDGHPIPAVTYVSRRWRDVAIATPELWKYIPIRGPFLTEPYSVEMKLFCERATRTGHLFVDCTTSNKQQSDNQMDTWASTLDVAAAEIDLNSTRGLSLHFSSTAPVSLRIPPFALEGKYIFYNIYPQNNPKVLVTSITLYFIQRPKKKNLLNVLQQFPNLTDYAVYLGGSRHLRTHYDVGTRTVSSSLRSLSVRLSLLPYFLSDVHSVSRDISSLNIYCDQPSLPSHTFMSAERWASTVELGRLDTGLRFLGIEGLSYIADTISHAAPLLIGLRGVVTLALCGHFLSPILRALSQDHTVLPILRRLELRDADTDESTIQNLLDSGRGSPQSNAVPIRELVLDHCTNIKRDFCDLIRGSVETLIIYC